jgi:MraZ protein
MLIGAYQHNMDLKGRVTIPAKFREDLGELFYVTKGLDGCLFVLSAAEWNRLQEKMKAMPIAKSVALQRFFFSGAAEVEPDKQGRILLPQQLRDYAGLDKDVTVTGVSSRAEIWDTARWEAFTQTQTQENIMEAMELLDF